MARSYNSIFFNEDLVHKSQPNFAVRELNLFIDEASTNLPNFIKMIHLKFPNIDRITFYVYAHITLNFSLLKIFANINKLRIVTLKGSHLRMIDKSNFPKLRLLQIPQIPFTVERFKQLRNLTLQHPMIELLSISGELQKRINKFDVFMEFFESVLKTMKNLRQFWIKGDCSNIFNIFKHCCEKTEAIKLIRLIAEHAQPGFDFVPRSGRLISKIDDRFCKIGR